MKKILTILIFLIIFILFSILERTLITALCKSVDLQNLYLATSFKTTLSIILSIIYVPIAILISASMTFIIRKIL